MTHLSKLHQKKYKKFGMRYGMPLAILWIAFAFVPGARAGHMQGNGGDYIRSTFFQVGQSVLNYLRTSEAGQTLVAKQNLNLETLESSLTIEKVTVQGEPLRDNGGSLVDAIGAPGRIILNQESWSDHFEKDRDVYFLVFHEMLRENGINDDNYIVSKALLPFPVANRVITRTNGLYPLMAGENLAGLVDFSKLGMNGSGCSSTALGTWVDFNPEKNQLDLVFRNFSMTVGSPAERLARKNCAVSIPFRLPSGKRLIVSQVDFSSRFRLAAKDSHQLSLEAFLTGTSGAPITRLVTAAQPTLARTLIRKTDVLKSACGGSALLRLNSAAYLKNGGEAGVGANPVSTVDADRMTVYLKLESCTGTR